MVLELQNQLLLQELEFTKISEKSIDENLKKIVEFYNQVSKQIAELIHNPEKISFATAIQPLIDLRIAVAIPKAHCTFPRQVHANPKIREKSTEADKVLEELQIEFDLNPEVFKVLDLYHKKVYPQEKETKLLDPEQDRFVEKLMQRCHRNGLHISDANLKTEVNNIKKRLADLCIIFSDNLNNENTRFVMDKNELVGMSESWFTKEREIEPGKFVVTLKYPDVHPILEFAQNREVRKRIYLAFNARCLKENLPILKEIFQLRKKLANILGYTSHADYMAEIRMLKNKAAVEKFLAEMHERFTPLLKQNLKDITEFARIKENDPAFELQYHDLNYYMRARTEEMFQIDMEKIKEYFPLERTIDGVLKIYEKLLGLVFVEAIATQNKWHPDVRVFRVYSSLNSAQINKGTEQSGGSTPVHINLHASSVNSSSAELVGEFYLDLHPREGKYGHAAIMDLFFGADIGHLPNHDMLPHSSKTRRLGNCAMVCNFPKNEGLSFWDFTTFFHEFGHIMHFICSKNKIPDFNGFNVELEFVEAPSQMLENWCYEESVLNALSCHVKTGEHLPREIALQMKAMDKLHAGYDKSRQLVYTYFDYTMHSLPAEELEKLNITNTVHHLQKNIIGIEPHPEECFPSSFGHIVGGYDVGYYGYLLSETYAMDMFYQVFQKDPISPMAGAKYRKTILEPGATRDAMDLLVDFLGREPKLDAFLMSCGLKSETDVNI